MFWENDGYSSCRICNVLNKWGKGGKLNKVIVGLFIREGLMGLKRKSRKFEFLFLFVSIVAKSLDEDFSLLFLFCCLRIFLFFYEEFDGGGKVSYRLGFSLLMTSVIELEVYCLGIKSLGVKFF